ncbi:alpha/beta-hydrolase [Astrocystis sublimbata]|nr:alpha/beta-hydrolase [Astrocystis sublimbata]
MRTFKWLPLALACLAAQPANASSPTVTIAVSNVTYKGVLRGVVEDFHNIKFAYDTSGEHRFAPPRPYTPPQGSTIDASEPGPACPQSKAAIPPFFAATPDQSEDCLHLRITRPAGTESKPSLKLPVVVHLVGGGVIKGSLYDPNYDPANLVAQSVALKKPIIHVAISYRLTIFGFARLPNLKAQKSLNVGMRDQRVALQWVKDSISAFGGDADKVTAFGLSAGGTFSSLHLMTYGGEKGVPFDQAWVMSGPPGTALNMTSDGTEIHTRAVARKLGCQDRTDDAAILECLRSTPMDELTEVAMSYSVDNHPPAGLLTFIPSIDDDFLPERQSALYNSGKFVKGVPIVFGYAQDDGASNIGDASAFQTDEDMKKPIREFAHNLSNEDYVRLFSYYHASAFKEEVRNYEARRAQSDPVAPANWFRISRIIRDLLFTCSSLDFGFEMTKQSRTENPEFAGVYHCVLNQSMITPLFQEAGMPYIGAVHGSDLDYLYNNMFPREQLSKEDEELSNIMITAFLNFAYTGRPGGSDSIPWPESFPDLGTPNLKGGITKSFGPRTFNLQVLGGPLGTGVVHLEREDTSHIASFESEGNTKIAIDDAVENGEMGSRVLEERQRQLSREDLFGRCDFINSLAEKLAN